jgi:(p)ppGpp synthase/HD superfamily hydrolase
MFTPSNPQEADAFAFADDAHAGQFRKYVGRPYIEHPAAVARLVRRFSHDSSMVVAALLHDVREDCGVHAGEIVRRFGGDVSALVDDLTDVSRPQDGNRAARKLVDLEHTLRASPRAKTIKCLDLVHNKMSIVVHDPDFAIVYLAEKAMLLDVLGDASDPKAHALAARVHARAVARLQSVDSARPSVLPR